MAEEDLSLDDPNENTETEEGESAGSKKKLIIIIAAVVTVLLIGGGIAAYFLLSDDPEETGEPVAESEMSGVDGETVIPEELATTVKAPPKGDAIYISVAEPFLVNVKAGKRTRMMQIKIEFMVKSKEAEDAVKSHLPLIRNNLLDYFSLADAKEAATKEGRAALKDGALETAQEVIKGQVGFEAIEMILFTGFVIQ